MMDRWWAEPRDRSLTSHMTTDVILLWQVSHTVVTRMVYMKTCYPGIIKIMVKIMIIMMSDSESHKGEFILEMVFFV